MKWWNLPPSPRSGPSFQLIPLARRWNLYLQRSNAGQWIIFSDMWWIFCVLNLIQRWFEPLFGWPYGQKTFTFYGINTYFRDNFAHRIDFADSDSGVPPCMYFRCYANSAWFATVQAKMGKQQNVQIRQKSRVYDQNGLSSCTSTLSTKDYLLHKNKVEDYFTDLFSRVAWDTFF